MNVIFDLGNVLLNWDIDNIVQSVGVNKTLQLELQHQLFQHQDWLDLDCGLVTETEVLDRVLQRSSLTPNVIQRAFAIAKESLTPIPESLSLFHDIHSAGIPLYCLSNMSVETYRYLDPRMDFFRCFRGMVISGVEKCMKPDRTIFELVLHRYALEASSTLFIDDSPANISTAKVLGFSTHLFKRTDECYSNIKRLAM